MLALAPSFLGVVSFAAVCVLFWGWVETWLVRKSETEFRSPAVSESFDGYRIALLGGLHLRRLGWWTKRLQRLIQEGNPDVLLLGGNVKPSHRADNRKTHELLRRFLDPFEFPDGILAVPGYRDRKGFWNELPEDSMFHLLSSSHHLVGRGSDRIVFLGIASAHASHLDRGINYLRETLSAIPDDKGFRILLGQSGDLLRVAQGQPIHLILAVDNLHYQIRIPGVGVPRRDTKVPISWTRGWIKEGNLALFLSPGVGTRWLPFRFFLRPEIAFITLRSKR
jgi:predicted MPP superfamily phosphohydrolase